MFTLCFGDYIFPNQTFEVEGFPLDNETKEDNIIQRHGSVIQTPYLKSRKFKIRGYIHNTDEASSHSQFAEMQEYLLAGESQFKYRSDRYINCYTQKIKPDYIKGTDKAIIDIDINFIAQTPFFYSAGASYSDINNLNGGTSLFYVTNGGNVFSEPVIYVCATGGTIADDIGIDNLSNGESFAFRGTVADGKTLRIDSENFEVMNNLVDGLSYYEGDFVTLISDVNTFQFAGSTCRLTVEHKYRWY